MRRENFERQRIDAEKTRENTVNARKIHRGAGQVIERSDAGIDKSGNHILVRNFAADNLDPTVITGDRAGDNRHVCVVTLPDADVGCFQ